MLTYTLTIPNALYDALERARRMDNLKQGMVAAGGYLVGMLANYPPESHRPYPFKSEKQRRYVMWAIRKGIIKVPYVRTGVLQRSFGLSIENNGLTVRTGTNLDRAKWTHGEGQALYHRITGWKQARDIAEQAGGNVYMLIYNYARADFE